MTDIADDSKAIYLRLLRHVVPYWRPFALGTVMMIVLGLTEPAFPAILELVVSSFEERALDSVPLYAAFFLGVFLVRGLSSFLSVFLLESVAARLVVDLRRLMFDRLMRIPAPVCDNVASGTLISKVTYDAQQVTDAATRAVTVLVRDSVAVVGLLGWMLWIDWKLTLVALATAPLVMAIVVYFSRRLRRMAHGVQHTMGDVTHVLQESIEGHRVVKVFSGQDYETRRFSAAANRVRRFQVKFAAAGAATAPIAQMITAIALAIILLLCAGQFETGAIAISDFVSFFTAMALLFSPIKRLTRVNALIQKGIAAAASVFAMVDASVETDSGSIRIGRAEGRLKLDDITFRYHGDGGPPVLDAVSIAIEPGETVALVGPSGSGKTTIAGLIPRFYDPDGGCASLDGIDLRDLTLASLRANVALVSQDIVLFDDTVAGNIAYGATAGAAREAIMEAARTAHALEFIESMPQGMDTLIGERGMKLSGGQRQRLAIARAVLKDAPVLILDEATSSLDSESERYIQEAVETLRAGRTTLVIAHRLSTIEDADRIVVMEHGRIVDIGTHAELIKRNGLYAGLYRFQFFRRDEPPGTTEISKSSAHSHADSSSGVRY